MLGDGAGANEKVLRQPLDHGHQLLRYHHPAQPPAGHVEVFAEAVDADDAVIQRQRGLAKLGFKTQAQINLVHQGDAAFATDHLVDTAQLIRVNGGAGGV